jgi:hypothetical protein
METYTPWERMPLSAETQREIPEGFEVWSRLLDGQHVFAVVAKGNVPSEGNHGSRSIAAALESRTGGRGRNRDRGKK